MARGNREHNRKGKRKKNTYPCTYRKVYHRRAMNKYARMCRTGDNSVDAFRDWSSTTRLMNRALAIYVQVLGYRMAELTVKLFA